MNFFFVIINSFCNNYICMQMQILRFCFLFFLLLLFIYLFICSVTRLVNNISQDWLPTFLDGKGPWKHEPYYFWWWSLLFNLINYTTFVIKSQVCFIWETAAHRAKISSISKAGVERERMCYVWTLSALINIIRPIKGKNGYILNMAASRGKTSTISAPWGWKIATFGLYLQ